MRIAGHAVVWGDTAEVGDHFERVMPGAFQYATSTRLRIAHAEGDALLYRAQVREDATGLFFEAELDPARPGHRQVAAAVRAGMIGVSLGFRAQNSRWDGDTEVITAARLLEISLTGAGGYAASRCWIDELPCSAPDRSMAVDRARVAKPSQRSVTMSPAGAAVSAHGAYRPAAPPLDPVRMAVKRYMGRYLARMPVPWAVKRYMGRYLARMPVP